MLSPEEEGRLQKHVVGLINSLVLPEVTPEGCVVVRAPNGESVPDPVTTHHLVELCLEVDSRLFGHIVDGACEWFAQTSTSLQDPFLMTTLLRAGKVDRRSRAQIRETLIRAQHPGGFIDLYAGFLDGGSIFSTLWAVRILGLLGKDTKIRAASARALDAVRKNWGDVHRASFKGFFLELAVDAMPRGRFTAFEKRALNEVLASQAPDGLWDDSPLYTAYVLGNLCSLANGKKTRLPSQAIEGFRALFSLREEAKGIPDRIAGVTRTHTESVYLQTAIRACVSAARYLRRIRGRSVAEPVASAVLGAYPGAYHTALRLHTELKHMNMQYDGIRRHFAHLEQFAAPILKESAYERNVFVMMPFRQSRDERYEDIERVLRSELKKFGLRVWLASEKDLAPQLWDNVAAYMLACRYGIAVFTRIERDNRIEEEFNPNVSLELGFCLSRGRQVLILKDSALKRLQTDLVGQLYEEFDLNQVTRQLPKIVRRWAKNLPSDTALTAQPASN